MKMTKKVKLFVIQAVFVPLILMFGLIVIFASSYVNSTYGDNFSLSSFRFIANPIQLMNNLTGGTFSEIKTVAVTDVSMLEDTDYLDDKNAELLDCNACLVIRRDNEIIYCGSEKVTDEVIDQLPEYGIASSSLDGGMYLSQPENFLVKQQDFNYLDGSKGSVFLISYLGDMVPHFQKVMIKAGIVIVGVLMLTNMMITFFMYYEFLRPIKLLQDGTNRIKEGDLESDVEVIKDDEIGELCVSFNEMRAKLKESIDVRLKFEEENRELISNISHDLKTPITAIKGYVEGIMDGVADTPEKIDKYIKIIYNKANELDVLINELSIYTKIDNNTIPYNFTKIDIEDYFSDCIEDISIDVEEKGMDLLYFNYCEKGVKVVVDPEQMRRVINNIVINAIKYNDKEKGHINIHLRQEDEFVQISIEDNGKGISEKDIPLIFDRMYRTDSSRNSSKGGSGLGLSIAKKIVNEHGGNIWATSKKNIGTTIYFTIKIYKEEEKNEQ